MQTVQAQRVSFDDEQLIVVDEADNVVAFDSKANVHRTDGRLHRAFSIFLFNEKGQMLLHRRGQEKPLWPGYWTNSCCSHPRKGESYAEAAHRRLVEELGVSTPLNFLYQFQYHAAFADRGSENELCAVFVGRLADASRLRPNPSEIAEHCWLDCRELEAWLKESPDQFTPWFKLEWERLCTDQRAALEQICGPL